MFRLRVMCVPFVAILLVACSVHNSKEFSMVSSDVPRVYTDDELRERMDEPQLREALEYLRTRGSAREVYHELMGVLPKIADDIVAAFPNVKWEWSKPKTASGGGNNMVSGHYYGTSWSTPSVLFKCTFTDDMWRTAVGIVEGYAHRMGATERFSLPVADDIRFHSPTTDIVFIISRGSKYYQQHVVLDAETGLHLRQDIYDGETTIDQALHGVIPEPKLP